MSNKKSFTERFQFAINPTLILLHFETPETQVFTQKLSICN